MGGRGGSGRWEGEVGGGGERGRGMWEGEGDGRDFTGTPSLPSGLYGYNNIHGTWPLTVKLRLCKLRIPGTCIYISVALWYIIVLFMQALAPLLDQDPRSGPIWYIVVLLTQVLADTTFLGQDPRSGFTSCKQVHAINSTWRLLTMCSE